MKALGDAVALSDAVEKAADLTSQEDTLIIVTADHSHPFTVNGYPTRGRNILGNARFLLASLKPGYTFYMTTDRTWLMWSEDGEGECCEVAIFS